MKPKTIVLILLIVLAVIIIVQNSHVVQLRFLRWDINMSLIILTLLTLLIGFITGFIIAKLTGRQSK